MLSASLEADLRRFLAEDLGGGDVTAECVVPAGAPAGATLRAKAPGIVAGADLVEPIRRLLDPSARVAGLLSDGTRVEPGATVARMAADAQVLLAAERTLLNLVQRMSGIATLTARFVAAVAGTGVTLLDTRKTAPGLRAFDKRAVVAGGGATPRLGLHDLVLIKSTHLALRGAGADGRRPLEAAIARARARTPSIAIEIEVFDAEEALRAAAAGAELVMLDNFTPAAVAEAVKRVRARFPRERVKLEASGGIHLGNVREFAEAGVDRISVGALTHSAPALDLSLVVAPAAGGGAGRALSPSAGASNVPP